MSRCTRHPHSSEITARRCYGETIRRRLKREQRGEPFTVTYRPCHHDPPLRIRRGTIELWVFYSGERVL